MKLKGSENSILHGLMEDITINKEQVLFYRVTVNT